MIQGVLPKLTSDTVNEGLGTPEILPKENLELWSRDGSGAFVVALVLSLSEADRTTEKGGGKGDTIYPCGAGGIKIILTLLTKVVVIHVRFSGISFWGPSLEWALLRLRQCLSLGLRHLHTHLHEFCEKILGEGRNKRWSGSLKRGRSLDRSLIFPDVRFSDGALAGELIQLFSGISWSIDARAPTGGTRSWNYCKSLIVMLFFQTGWLTRWVLSV